MAPARDGYERDQHPRFSGAGAKCTRQTRPATTCPVATRPLGTAGSTHATTALATAGAAAAARPVGTARPIGTAHHASTNHAARQSNPTHL